MMAVILFADLPLRELAISYLGGHFFNTTPCCGALLTKLLFDL